MAGLQASAYTRAGGYCALALQGNTFLVIEAKDDDQVPRIAEVVNRYNATSADRYGRWAIEELTKPKESR